MSDERREEVRGQMRAKMKDERRGRWEADCACRAG